MLKITYREFIFCAIGFLIGFIFFQILSPILPSQINDKKITECFQILDKTVIYKAGTMEIGSIINASSVGNDSLRLNTIADLVTNNYTDGYWEKPNFLLLNNSQTFQYTDKGKVWISPPYNDLTRNIALDPNWMIYQKVGACRELSILYYSIVKKSGFSTRIVRTGDGDSHGVGATHWWNEIVINGVNKTFDVQYYGLIKYGVSRGSSWSGNRSDYIHNSDSITLEQLCNYKGVWVTDSEGHNIEDITSDYIPSYNCTIIDRLTTA